MPATPTAHLFEVWCRISRNLLATFNSLAEAETFATECAEANNEPNTDNYAILSGYQTSYDD